ncbi:MAG: PHP domain-containing protein [Lachnospiraceae bacterium]|nr:PHP domain-containing protein [Lachnospiraceae bacterium]MCI9374619.1 PHP domain-containing protein [Lachnospiraceae bacterium]
MSEKINLLPEAGHFYKANLHCHTVDSDGRLTHEEVKAEYQKRGYRIVAYTDHRKYGWHRELCDREFVALAAMEVDINEHFKVPGDFSRVKTYHINLYDAMPEKYQEEKQRSPLPERKYYDMDYINDYIRKMKAYGFFACYNHPYWSLQNYEDYKGLRGFWGMEIYNYGCDLDGMYGFHPQSYDEMLRLGNRLFCVAADDNHNAFPFEDPLSDSFGGFTMVKAPELTYGAVTEALLNGNFYSSMGPEIHGLSVEDGVLKVETSPVDKIFVMTQGRNCYREAAVPGQTISGGSFSLNGTEGYIRVQIRDREGRYACSNAYEMRGNTPVLRSYDMTAE